MSREKLRNACNGAAKGVKSAAISILMAPVVWAITPSSNTPSVRKRGGREHRRENPEWIEESIKQERHEETGTLEPLTTRPRSLSIESQHRSLEEVAPLTFAQNDAAFITLLPKDVRLLIYELALGSKDRPLHLARAHDRLTHIRCFGDTETKPPWRHLCWGQAWRDGAFRTHHPNRLPDDRDLIGLLQTCRIIYSEAVEILYTANTFHIRQHSVLQHLSRAVLQSRMDSVRHLQLDFIFHPNKKWSHYYPAARGWLPDDLNAWPETCRILSTMRGLRTLDIDLIFYGWHSWTDGTVIEVDVPTLVSVLEGLKGVAVSETFGVTLSCDVPEVVWYTIKDAPFKMRVQEQVVELGDLHVDMYELRQFNVAGKELQIKYWGLDGI